MPDYKRKKFKKGLKAKRERTSKSNDIIMSSSNHKKVVPENDIKVVRGKKLNQKRRTKFLFGTVAVICAICFFLSLLLPVSLYENVVNTVSVWGHGSYPANVSGSSVINCISNESYYYVLTDTNVTAYSNGGKKIFSEMHGFSNPVISVSSTRAIVFDQGGKNLYVYNLSGQINTITTKYEIINANISRSGSIVVATHSDSYTSAVTVYDKNCEQIYTWNSAKDIVNNVLLNSKGNKIAVSTLNASSGQYNSNVLILDFKSADALFTLNLGTSVVLSLQNTGRGISVITNDKYKFINWSKFTTNEITASGEINVCRTDKNGVLLLFNRANDRSDNTAVLISNKGEKTSEFKIGGIITDIAYERNRIYYISDNNVNIIDKNGGLLRSGLCDYGAVKLSVIGANSLAVVTDQQILKTDINKGE